MLLLKRWRWWMWLPIVVAGSRLLGRRRCHWRWRRVRACVAIPIVVLVICLLVIVSVVMTVRVRVIFLVTGFVLEGSVRGLGHNLAKSVDELSVALSGGGGGSRGCNICLSVRVLPRLLAVEHTEAGGKRPPETVPPGRGGAVLQAGGRGCPIYSPSAKLVHVPGFDAVLAPLSEVGSMYGRLIANRAGKVRRVSRVIIAVWGSGIRMQTSRPTPTCSRTSAPVPGTLSTVVDLLHPGLHCCGAPPQPPPPPPLPPPPT